MTRAVETSNLPLKIVFLFRALRRCVSYRLQAIRGRMPNMVDNVRTYLYRHANYLQLTALTSSATQDLLEVLHCQELHVYK